MIEFYNDISSYYIILYTRQDTDSIRNIPVDFIENMYSHLLELHNSNKLTRSNIDIIPILVSSNNFIKDSSNISNTYLRCSIIRYISYLLPNKNYIRYLMLLFNYLKFLIIF